jgi:rRNA maturation protein Nop10
MNQPMTLANMRENGVYSVIAICVACGHRVNVNVDALPETIAVPEAGLQLRCGQCGGNRINTQPAGFMAPGNFGRERARE